MRFSNPVWKIIPFCYFSLIPSGYQIHIFLYLVGVSAASSEISAFAKKFKIFPIHTYSNSSQCVLAILIDKLFAFVIFVCFRKYSPSTMFFKYSRTLYLVGDLRPCEDASDSSDFHLFGFFPMYSKQLLR